jgi:hypothetical protein
MPELLDSPVQTEFVDRRSYDAGMPGPARERRQFTNSHDELSPEARDLARAIDEYKLLHRRRFITYEEMLGVIKELGYRK